MRVRVLGWSYRGIRGGLRHLDIDLADGASRWTLIQMPNGTGKTTTMDLLRAIFTAASLNGATVRSFRPDDGAVEGLFEVRLAVDGKLYRLQLRLDYRTGTCSYWTTRTAERSGGLEEGLKLPLELGNLLTPEFTRLFVFDGELAEEIRSVGKERAADAIRTLYRLDRLKELNSRVGRLVECEQQRAAAISTASKLPGIRRWQSALDAAVVRRDALTRRHAELGQQARSLADRQADLTAQIRGRLQQDEAFRERQDKLLKERALIDQAIFDGSVQGLALLRSPDRVHPRLHGRLVALGERLTKLKLPKTISSEFFVELAQGKECVCGRPISAKEKGAILKRSSLYLAEDQISVINKMKQTLRDSGNAGVGGSSQPSTFIDVIAPLRAQMRQRSLNDAAQEQLKDDRVAAGDTELEALRLALRNVEDAQRSNRESIEALTTRDVERQKALRLSAESNLPLCEADVKRCTEALATATNTRRFVQQADLVKNLVNTVAARALDRLRERVRAATNHKLQQFVRGEALEVTRIGGALELASTGLATKEGVSMGQSLAVAYAFLTSLLSQAPYELPFIVDSPAVSLDTAVRREVGELIPDLFDQMIVFVISSEREGFADAFYDRSGVRYITLWRDGQGGVEVREGQSFFRQFHTLEAAE